MKTALKNGGFDLQQLAETFQIDGTFMLASTACGLKENLQLLVLIALPDKLS